MEKGGEEEEEPGEPESEGRVAPASVQPRGERRSRLGTRQPAHPPGVFGGRPLAGPRPGPATPGAGAAAQGRSGQGRRQAGSPRPRPECRSTGARWCPSACARATRRSRSPSSAT